jgi:hypothetical protein
MRKLTCISTDKYGYEEESLNFIYNGVVVFWQINSRLNRGGKTLELYDTSVKEMIVSSGSYNRGEKWWKKMQKNLSALNYDIEWTEIKEAIDKRRKENAGKNLADLNRLQSGLKKELDTCQRKIVYLSKQVRENKIKIAEYNRTLLIKENNE